MRLTNIIAGSALVSNTGVADVTKSFGSTIGVLLTRKGWTLTATQVADFLNKIKAALVADNQDDRIYLIGKFHTTEMQYGDRQANTRPDGSEVLSRAATAGWRFITDTGGFDFAKILQTFDGLEDVFNVVFINKRFDGGEGHSFWGTSYYNSTTGEFEFTGLDLSKLEIETPMVGTFDDVDRYPLAIRLAEKDQLFANGWCIDSTIDAFGTNVLPSIHTVQITKLSDPDASGVFDIGMALGSGAINLALASNYSAWANVARFRAFNKDTGAAITITSVARNTAQTGFTINLDETDTDYPATTGDLVGIELVAVSTLAAAGLSYFESEADNPTLGGRSKALYVPVA